LQKSVALIIEGNSNQIVLEENQMRDNNKNILQETQAAFALAVLLLNFLILAIVIGFFWSLQLLISPSSPLSVALGETIWR
jgi:hypothetical protein